MNFLLAMLIFSLCFAAMAVGLVITKKTLRRGCSIDPDSCSCRKEGKDPDQCSKS